MRKGANAMQLNELQGQVKAALLSKETPSAAAHAIRGGSLPPEARLQIHRNNVIITLTEALAAVYPAIARLVGEAFFKALSAEFIRKHPPSQGTLTAYGNLFPDFLETFGPARQLPYLPDMARLEWARNEAFHAADALPLTARSLANVAPNDMPRLRFTLSPSARLLASDFPLVDLWNFTQTPDDPEEAVEIPPAPARLLIHRPDMEVVILSLGKGAFAFLEALDSGSFLLEAFDAASEIEPEFNLQETLSDLIESGVFTAVTAQ